MTLEVFMVCSGCLFCPTEFTPLRANLVFLPFSLESEKPSKTTNEITNTYTNNIFNSFKNIRPPKTGDPHYSTNLFFLIKNNLTFAKDLDITIDHTNFRLIK